MGLGGNWVSTCEYVCGTLFDLVGRESVMDVLDNVGGVPLGIGPIEVVGVTVGAMIGFEGAAFVVAEVFRAGDRS